jgi:chromosome segregation ATPase
MERDDLKERVAALEEMILREASSSESSTDKGDDDFGADTCTSNNTREGLILLQRQYSQLEHQVFQLESERGNVEAENKRLLHACETCKLDNEMIAKQKEALASQCSLVEKRLELQSDDACKVKAEMERLKSESEANKERAIELEERYDAIEEDKGIMKIKLERIEKDLLSARKRQGSSEKALEKEVQRAALYRQKALEAHERSQRAKEALACLTLNVSEN